MKYIQTWHMRNVMVSDWVTEEGPELKRTAGGNPDIDEDEDDSL